MKSQFSLHDGKKTLLLNLLFLISLTYHFLLSLGKDSTGTVGLQVILHRIFHGQIFILLDNKASLANIKKVKSFKLNCYNGQKTAEEVYQNIIQPMFYALLLTTSGDCAQLNANFRVYIRK